MYFIIPARKIFVRYRVLKLMLMVLKYRDLNDVWVYVVSANKMEKYSEEKKKIPSLDLIDSSLDNS